MILLGFLLALFSKPFWSMNNSNNSGFDFKYNTFSMIRILNKLKCGLKIAHINAQSLHGKMDEFQYIFENSKVDIICVSETWFKPEISDRIYNLHDYHLYRSDRLSHAGGVAIYVHNHIKCRTVCKSEPNDKIEFILLEISNGFEKVLIGNVYRPHHTIDFSPLISIISLISLNYKNIIISGDFNSNLLREKLLLHELQSIGLNSVNTNAPTHFTATSQTLLDLFITNELSKILLYEQLSVPVFSKHDLIFTTFNFSTQIKDTENSYSYRDFKSINHEALTYKATAVPWEQLYLLLTVDEKIEFLQSNLLNLFNEFVPLKTKKITHKNKPWFNDEIKNFIDLRNIAFARWKRFKIASLHSVYCNLRNSVTAKIRSAKVNHYEHKFNMAISSKSKWRIIRNIGITKDKCYAQNVPDVDELNRHFLNLPSSDGRVEIYQNLRSDTETKFEFDCFRNDDVFSALMSIKSDATGLDDIHPFFIKLLLPIILPYITHIYNFIVMTSSYPTAWKYAKVLPIPKSDKEYRPIAILPFISKAFERLLHNQINSFIMNNNLLTDKQSGFRTRLSCVTALTKVTEDIRYCLDGNQIAFLILLDHSKAFDTVDHNILLLKLEGLFNFSTSAVRLVASYLYGRFQAVYSGNRSSQFLEVTRGVPQGSILGPLLYTIYANDLPEQLKFCNIHMYADDVQLYTSCSINDINNCTERINTDLSNVLHWAAANKLCINPKKSKCLLIHKRRQKPVSDRRLILGDSHIEIVETAKNLGVTINEYLDWSDHVNITTGKIYGMLRNLWCTQWFTPLKIRMDLAKTYLIPTLLYGCEIFAFCSSASKRKLNVTYNNIARYIFGLKRFESVSEFSKQIFGISFDNLLICRSLIFLHKIIYTGYPTYLFEKLTFLRSNRGKCLKQIKHNIQLSEQHFFFNVIRIWNQLPPNLQTNSNARQFKTLVFNHFKN